MTKNDLANSLKVTQPLSRIASGTNVILSSSDCLKLICESPQFQFVKGELLEGDNAYFCEKCHEKRNAIKRMCIRTLPQTLVIQLKRFHYDWETNRALKFDDFFQFPWTIDMGPYTTEGIQRAESDPITAASIAAELDKEMSAAGAGSEPTLAYRKVSFSSAFSRNNPDLHYPYELVGIVVHSGQANAGHYYSYIKVP